MEIKNGNSSDTVSIEHTRHGTNNQKTKTILNTENQKIRGMDPTKTVSS